jgi:AraC-like DNA-binding protein
VKPAYDSVPEATPPARLGWVRAFDTSHLPEHERYSCWRDADVAGLSTRFDTKPDEPFRVTMDWLDLGTMGIGTARITAQDWVRTAANAAQDDNDDLVISVRHSGAAIADMAGRNAVASAGAILLGDMAQVQRHYSEASVSTGFAVPRAFAESFLPSVRSLHGHVIAPEHAVLLASHLTALGQHAGNLPASSGPAVAQTVLDLLAVALGASMGERPADVAQHERALRVQLRDTIERHLGSPSLNTARLSRMLGVSRSTLYRLLQDEGGVQAYVRSRRLARVAETLRTQSEGETIAVLADRWGFCDAAYLGRAFREVYGVTPGDYRALHAGGTRRLRPDTLQKGG